jgi:hypothetical protein
MRVLRGSWGAAAGTILVLLLGSSVLAEGFRPITNPPLLRFTAVKVPEPFLGIDGKTLEPGTYEFELSAKGMTAIIGVLRGGQRVAETTGKLALEGTDKVSAADFFFDRTSELSHEGNRFKLVPTAIKRPGSANRPPENLSGSLTFELPASKASARGK